MLYRRDYIELILFGIHSPDYLFTAGKYIHEATIAPCNHFCSAKKNIREAQTHVLHVTAQRSTTPKKRKSCLCEAQTHDLHIIAQCSTTQ